MLVVVPLTFPCIERVASLRVSKHNIQPFLRTHVRFSIKFYRVFFFQRNSEIAPTKITLFSQWVDSSIQGLIFPAKADESRLGSKFLFREGPGKKYDVSHPPQNGFNIRFKGFWLLNLGKIIGKPDF